MTFFANESKKQQLYYKKCSLRRAEDSKAGRMQTLPPSQQLQVMAIRG